MGFFRRKGHERDDRGAAVGPSPFVAEVLRRIGEDYGGFDAIGPLPPGVGGPGMEVTIHVAGEPDPGRPDFLQGSGIIRTARVFAGHTEVHGAQGLIARFDDLTTADVFGGRT